MNGKPYLLAISLISIFATLAAAQPPATRQQLLDTGVTDPEAVLRTQASAVPAPAWGTTTDTALRLTAAAFSPRAGVLAYDTDGTGERHRNTFTVGSGTVTTDSFFDAQLDLPEGAKVTGLRIDYCDTDAVNDIYGFILRADEPSGANFTAFPSALLFSSGAPGCTSSFADLTSSNLVIDNINHSYWVRFRLDSVGVTLQLRGAIIFYRLQVSPAPGTATFADVPTSHPFFQYIEALAASGITGGCATPPLQYCPDAPVTRGQMAVFISRALGLHWAP